MREKGVRRPFAEFRRPTISSPIPKGDVASIASCGTSDPLGATVPIP
jgi:hypothetical protein